MSDPGTIFVIHDKPTQRTSWGPNETPGWYVVSVLDHYRRMKLYILVTGFIRVTDTLHYITNKFPSGKTALNITSAR